MTHYQKNENKGLVILSIIHRWPSREHPYLVHLFSRLKAQFPGLQLFIFQKAETVNFAEDLVGKEAVTKTLESAYFRWSFSRNLFRFIKPIFSLLQHPFMVSRMFNKMTAAGYTKRQAVGQLLHNHEIVGKKFDLVYINALQSAKHFPLRIFFGDTPIIASSRGQDFDLNPDGYNEVLRQLNYLHVLGDYLGDKAIATGFDAKKIVRIPPAILPLRVDPVRQQEKKKVRIVSVSRLYWIKGYVYALRAIALLRKKIGAEPFEYIIIGDGPAKQEIQVEIERLQLTDCIKLTGWLSQQEVDSYMINSDIFLLLSIAEGFNNSVMQAQQLGLPCVVSNAGGLPENVLHGETGFVVPRYTVAEAAQSLYILVSNPSLRATMAENGIKHAAEKFNLEDQIKLYENMWLATVK